MESHALSRLGINISLKWNYGVLRSISDQLVGLDFDLHDLFSLVTVVSKSVETVSQTKIKQKSEVIITLYQYVLNDVNNIYRLSLTTYLQTTKAFLSEMLSRDHGHVVTISSLLGFMGFAGAGDYCASKFASTGFTETLTVEISREDCTDVHVTSVHPYVINTDMFAGISSRYDP